MLPIMKTYYGCRLRKEASSLLTTQITMHTVNGEFYDSFTERLLMDVDEERECANRAREGQGYRETKLRLCF